MSVSEHMLHVTCARTVSDFVLPQVPSTFARTSFASKYVRLQRGRSNYRKLSRNAICKSRARVERAGPRALVRLRSARAHRS
eukprot:955070-Prymnesium_polylepis.1